MRQASGMTLGVLAGLLLLTPPAAHAAPPANDAFAAAQAVPAASGAASTVSGTTLEGTRELGEPIHAGVTGRRSIWFSWTADATRRVSVDTCGSGFDTLLGVYTGTAVGSLTAVASNNDSRTCPGRTRSSLSFDAAGGETYMVAVDGRGNSSGSVALTIAYSPEYDDLASARATIPATGLPAMATATNVGATKEDGEASHAGSSGGRSVWFSWRAAASGSVRVDTCGSSFDTLLGVYRVDGGGLQHAGSNDDGCGDQSAVVISATAGEEYRIAIDGWLGASGTIALSLTPVASTSAPTPTPTPTPGAPGVPTAALPTIEVSDVTLDEPSQGPLEASFTVSLSAPSALPVTVQYASRQISAQAHDFTAVTGRIAFPPGETSQQVGVVVKPDSASERSEQLALDLRQPVNARLGRGYGILTIVDRDLPLPGRCGPDFCMEPGLGPVRMSNTGASAELVETIPITRRPRERAVMRLGTDQLGSIGAGDRLEASAEVEVSVTCLEPMKKCVGTRYRYSPRVAGQLVLTRDKKGTDGIAVSDRRQLTCSQALPHRNHHCVLVFPSKRTEVAGGCGSCYLKLVLSASHPTARAGNRLVIGSDAGSGVQHDRGQINAVVVSPGAEEPKLAVERSPARRSIPVASRSEEGLPQRVIYSLRLDDLQAHEQLAVDARALVRTSHLPYGTFIGAHLVLSGSPGAVGPVKRDGVRIGAPITEKNGFNCTRGRSAHDNPCEVRKVGLLRVKRAIEGPAYVNLVVQAAARFGGRWSKGHSGKVLRKGALRVRRYGPMGWLELTPLP